MTTLTTESNKAALIEIVESHGFSTVRAADFVDALTDDAVNNVIKLGKAGMQLNFVEKKRTKDIKGIVTIPVGQTYSRSVFKKKKIRK